MKTKRQTLEMLSLDMYWSEDHWVTVHKCRAFGHYQGTGPSSLVTDKAEADRVRYLALIQSGNVRDDREVA